MSMESENITEKVTEHAVPKPIVAIVGRPNVGKSTLFNRIIGWQKAIVEDEPGVTRDRIYADVEWGGREFILVDTGGFDLESQDMYLSRIKGQVEIAIAEADLILFVMDSTTGAMPQDIELLDLLRRSERNVLYVLAKIDHEKHEQREYEFHKLGIERFHLVSAVQSRNIYELMEDIIDALPGAPPVGEPVDEGIIRVAVVGRPNVGKSTLVNNILGEERLLTSPVAGTTRDSIDTLVERGGKKYLFVDTAGIRRRSRVTESVERYSVLRAVRTIERSDVVLLMVDSQEGPKHQDAALAEMIAEKGRASIVLLNKWDLVPREVAETTGIDTIALEGLKEIDYSPVLTLSALTGKRVHKLFALIDEVYANFSSRVGTRRLNDFLKDITAAYPPPLHNGLTIKFYYMSQVDSRPPVYVFFTNSAKGIAENYKRYIENRMRESFVLKGSPVKFVFRARRQE